MVKHIVFWNFNEKARAEDIPALSAEMSKRFSSLNGQIDGLLHIEFGVNYKEGGHNASLYCEFVSREAEAAYQKNPAHVAVASFVRQYFCDRTCVDYEL